MSNKVPSNCLGQTTETRCTVWMGPDYPELNIKQGDSLEYVIGQIISVLGSGTFSQSSNNIDLSCLESANASPCGAMISYRKLSISTSSSTGGVNVSWDSTGIDNALPEGYSLTGAQVLIRDKTGGIQFSGSQFTGQTSIQLARFPIFMDYTVFVYTPCGSVRLTKEIMITSDPGTKESLLNLIDVPTAASSVTTVEEAIEILAREVCSIKNQLS